MSYHEAASANRSPWTAGVTSEVRKAAVDPSSQLILTAEIWLTRPWNSSTVFYLLLTEATSSFNTCRMLLWLDSHLLLNVWILFFCFPEMWSQRQVECIAALFSSVSWMNELGIPFASKSSIILFLVTGADHHHVYFRLSEWLGGARLPLCSKGSHHPVSASEERGLASSHSQPLQRHSVRFCLGSQLQLLERCLPPSCLPPIHACRTTSVWQS